VCVCVCVGLVVRTHTQFQESRTTTVQFSMLAPRDSPPLAPAFPQTRTLRSASSFRAVLGLFLGQKADLATVL
jgi:hypothetical protein